jgi:hypothetical protein
VIEAGTDTAPNAQTLGEHFIANHMDQTNSQPPPAFPLR